LLFLSWISNKVRCFFAKWNQLKRFFRKLESTPGLKEKLEETNINIPSLDVFNEFPFFMYFGAKDLLAFISDSIFTIMIVFFLFVMFSNSTLNIVSFFVFYLNYHTIEMAFDAFKSLMQSNANLIILFLYIIVVLIQLCSALFLIRVLTYFLYDCKDYFFKKKAIFKDRRVSFKLFNLIF
jgi:hypothetical protein